MKTFLDNRRDSAIWNCGMYCGLAWGWAFDPVVRWLVSLVPFMPSEPPFPIPVFQTVVCMGFGLAAALIIQSRDNEQARLDAMPHTEERDG